MDHSLLRIGERAHNTHVEFQLEQRTLAALVGGDQVAPLSEELDDIRRSFSSAVVNALESEEISVEIHRRTRLWREQHRASPSDLSIYLKF